MKYVFYLLLLSNALIAQRTYSIPYFQGKPDIDGFLDSTLYDLPVADSFTTTLPTYGRVPDQATVVRMCYTRYGLYLFVECFSDRVRTDFTQRDEVGYADYFTLALDTWHDGQNAFEFTVTPAGQRIDQRNTSANEGLGFDAPWRLKTKVRGNRWVAEIHIPYEAIRFPNGQEREWGIQFTRFDRHTGQTSTWNPQDPLIEDRVLQYGVLVGLKDVKAGFRGMVTLFYDTQTRYEAENNLTPSFLGSFSDTVTLAVASDLKLSWDAASSLDISLLPDWVSKVASAFFVGLPPAPPSDGVFDWPYKVNRPVNEQDRGLLDKSHGFRDYAFLKENMVEQQPAAFFLDEVQLLNRAQFTTRTRDNWGVAVRNELFERTAYYSDKGIFQKTGFTNHNFLAVEKALSNNSWVHFSNSFYRLGDQRLANQLGASTQLRDRTNRYEVKASSRLQTQTGFSVADLSMSVGRINSAVIYGATYDSPTKTRPHLLVPTGAFSPLTEQHRATLYWGKRDYTPKTEKWQNAQFLTQLDLESRRGLVYEQPVQWRNRFTALDRHFRQWEGGTILYPLGAKIAIQDVDITYYLTSGLPLGFSLGYTSDNRRRDILGVTYENLFFVGTNQSQHRLGLQYNWVASRFFRIHLATDLHYAYQKPFGQNILVNKRQIEFSNVLGGQGQLGCEFHTGNRLSVTYRYLYQYVGLYNRRLYTVSNTSMLEPSGYEYAANPSEALLSQHELGLNWFLTRMSALRFSWAWGQGENLRYVLLVDDASLYQQSVNRANLSFVVNLNLF